MTNRADIDDGYAAWAERLVAEGCEAYFLTFMFNHLGGSPASVGHRMLTELERLYRLHVTRVVRKPNAPSHLADRPVWFCSLDQPVFKHSKMALADLLPNDGRHAHATAFYSPRSRLHGSLADHFEACRDFYLGAGSLLRRIDVTPVTHRVSYVVRYGRKSVWQGLDADADLVLPVDRRMARARHQADHCEAQRPEQLLGSR